MAKVKFKRYETNTEAEASQIEDGSFIVTKDGHTYIDYGTQRVATSGTPDTEIDFDSENTVQNKVIAEYIDDITIKADTKTQMIVQALGINVGNWSSSANYSIGDIVISTTSYLGINVYFGIWENITGSNSSSAPGIDTTNWQLVPLFVETGINPKLLRGFSTKEVVVGTWFGKPLYSRTINTGAISSANKTLAHGISNVDHIHIDTANSYLTGGTPMASYPFPRIHSNFNGMVWGQVDPTNIYIQAGSNANFSNSYITLLYTKTTD